MSKKTKNKILFVLLVGCLLSGCASKVNDKTFEKDDMSIVLTGKFKEDEVAGQTACYKSPDSIVVILKEGFKIIGTYNTEGVDSFRYAELVAESNGFEYDVDVIEGIPTFIYHKTVNEKDFAYLTASFKGTDAFYLIQFACEADRFEELKPLFIKWAKTFKHS